MAAQPLAGKIALVTGSSRGIGAAIAARLVDDGASVVVNYVNNAAAAEKVVTALNAKRSGAAVAVQADVSSVSQARALFEKSVAAFGRIDILVLNAGVMGMKPLADFDEEYYDTHFNTNVKGPLFLVKTAAPTLESGARVIFFSSSLAHMSVVPPAVLVYTAAKGAVEQITRVLAKDLGPRGITVNCVAPGPIDTDLFRNGKTEQQIAFFTNLHPQKRLGEPEEVAHVVAFLASPDASWVSGQTLMVNGVSALSLFERLSKTC
ncbi:hypothetical protein M0805_003946 [Coniferiporia weirii]|nr:hypothetical protein M0805_003946 [Coniferiporia weirii]